MRSNGEMVAYMNDRFTEIKKHGSNGSWDEVVDLLRSLWNEIEGEML
jgi:hypothetical protein